MDSLIHFAFAARYLPKHWVYTSWHNNNRLPACLFLPRAITTHTHESPKVYSPIPPHHHPRLTRPARGSSVPMTLPLPLPLLLLLLRCRLVVAAAGAARAGGSTSFASGWPGMRVWNCDGGGWGWLLDDDENGGVVAVVVSCREGRALASNHPCIHPSITQNPCTCMSRSTHDHTDRIIHTQRKQTRKQTH